MKYDEALSAYKDGLYGAYDISDFGNLEKIERHEYLGAALWQLHKSLTHPLKSIIKMVLLKMLLDSPDERLICHQFRRQVLSEQNYGAFADPAVFTMDSILDYYQDKEKRELEFLKECFYLRCKVKPCASRHSLKK